MKCNTCKGTGLEREGILCLSCHGAGELPDPVNKHNEIKETIVYDNDDITIQPPKIETKEKDSIRGKFFKLFKIR